MAPAALAARSAASVSAAPVSDSAGVMPEMWNQRAPSKMASPVELVGRSLGDGRAVAVVDHGRGALRGPGLHEVDAQATGSPDDVVGLDLHRAQGADGGVAERARRQGRDVARAQPVVGHRHGHVGLAAGEGRLQRAALEQPLVAGRLQPQHDLAERDDERAVGDDRFHGARLLLRFAAALGGRAGRGAGCDARTHHGHGRTGVSHDPPHRCPRRRSSTDTTALRGRGPRLGPAHRQGALGGHPQQHGLHDRSRERGDGRARPRPGRRCGPAACLGRLRGRTPGRVLHARRG